MRKYLLPLAVFVFGLVVAQVFFGIDIRRMFVGFGEFILRILGAKDW